MLSILKNVSEPTLLIFKDILDLNLLISCSEQLCSSFIEWMFIFLKDIKLKMKKLRIFFLLSTFYDYLPS